VSVVNSLFQTQQPVERDTRNFAYRYFLTEKTYVSVRHIYAAATPTTIPRSKFMMIHHDSTPKSRGPKAILHDIFLMYTVVVVAYTALFGMFIIALLHVLISDFSRLS